jgi:tetratricopeptide (TPR) repeat protein
MEATSKQPKLWSATQAYVLSIICLLAGAAAGYLLHAPASPPADVAQVSQQKQHAAPNQSGPPTPEQLKQMADKAVEPLLAELQKTPKNQELLDKISATYLATQQYQSAVEYGERSVAVKATAPALTQLASAYFFAGSGDKAIATLKQALQVDPNYADAMFNLGKLQWQVNSDPKAAIALWEKLLKTHPDHPKRAEVEREIANAKQHSELPPGTKADNQAR